MAIELVCGKFEEVRIPDNVRLCFLDPPDNEGRAYETYSDKIRDNDYIDLMRIWVDKACRHTYGPVFVSIAEKWIPHLEQAIIEMRIPLIQRIWWYYSFGQSQDRRKRYALCVRPIYWLNEHVMYPEEIRVQSVRQQIGDKRAAKEGKLPPNLWQFSRICGTFKERKKWHPTQHPQALLRRIILGHSRPGDLVLDGFIGSGTTAYVCNELGRHCVGIDMSQFYLDKILENINGEQQ